eukprot:UN06430
MLQQGKVVLTLLGVSENNAQTNNDNNCMDILPLDNFESTKQVNEREIEMEGNGAFGGPDFDKFMQNVECGFNAKIDTNDLDEFETLMNMNQ